MGVVVKLNIMEHMKESIPIEALIPFNLSAIGPTDEKLRRILSIKRNNLWKKTPYLHERGWISAFVGFLEREAQGKLKDPSYLEELKKFFRWHASLNPKHFPKQERFHDREPLFIQESQKLIIVEQLKKLEEEDFLDNPQNLTWLKTILQTYYTQINQAGIFLPKAEAIKREISLVIKS